MATFSAYTPYMVPSDAGFLYQTGRNLPYNDQEFFMSVDPALRHTSDEYISSHQDTSSFGQLPFHMLPASANTVPVTPGTSVNHYFLYEQPSYSQAHETPKDSPYSQPIGSNLSQDSSEYGWHSDSAPTLPALGTAPEESFKFAPLPAGSQPSPHSGWSVDSGFMPPLTPMSETEPRMQSVAMKELEFDSPRDATFDQEFHGDKLNSVQMQFALQPTPEELDLSESFAELGPLRRTTTMSTQALEMSEEDYMSPGRSPQSESDLCPSSRPSLRAELSSMHIQPVSHGRTPSSASARSVRGLAPGHPILDAQSRIRKGRPSKGSPPSQSINKEKSRSKGSTSRLTAFEQGRGEKLIKSFPCAFHLFGCPVTFGNKNEWKRHVSSQHLKLVFYRCDMGNCNPENNPKLYVPAEKPSLDSIKQEMTEGDEEDSDVIFNDFNRKDLFTQHCRRMHGPLRFDTDNTTMTNRRINARIQRLQDQGAATKAKIKSVVTKEDEALFENELEEIRFRCRILRRKAPARTSCGFCSMVFEVDPEHVNDLGDEGKAEEKMWEERMEHIGKHYERDGCMPYQEGIDDDLADWGVSVGILEYIVDSTGVRRPWLVGCETRSQPVHGDENDGTETKLTGIRHKSEQKRAGLRSKRELPPSQSYRGTVAASDEDDASAEDE